jgi:hypothetical protein
MQRLHRDTNPHYVDEVERVTRPRWELWVLGAGSGPEAVPSLTESDAAIGSCGATGEFRDRQDAPAKLHVKGGKFFVEVTVTIK